jgi:hypothetical protein
MTYLLNSCLVSIPRLTLMHYESFPHFTIECFVSFIIILALIIIIILLINTKMPINKLIS